jgi:hypothetical protein
MGMSDFVSFKAMLFWEDTFKNVQEVLVILQ